MKPQVEPLAKWQRKMIFLVLLLAFLLSLPAFMFYATGYRYDFFSDAPSITATGGLYIAAKALDSAIYVNDVEITDARLFRNASYIQGLTPGLHKIHVQAPGLNTWVKNLSVYPHIVTEAESFNLPLVPQVRPITQYQTVNGEALFFVKSTSTEVMKGASSTTPFVLSTSTATSTYRLNSEYVLLKELFAKKASTTQLLTNKKESFGFSASTTTLETEIATTTVIRGNLALYQFGEDVFAKALGEGRKIPHYFCTSQIEIETDKDAKMGAAVVSSQEELLFDDTVKKLSDNPLECRTEIRIDRKYQKVLSFDFLPTNENLVLMLIEDGLWVVEIDDRSWQNAQILYPGRDLKMVVHGGSVFVQEGNLILEVLTEIPVL